MITIDEAAAKWSVKPKTVLDYIYKGYIPGIECKDNRLMVPDLPKPYVKAVNQKLNQEAKYRVILKICNAGEYIDAHLLNITDEQFEAYINQLEKAGCLEKGTPSADSHSSLGWLITPAGVKMFSEGKLSLSNITINNTMNNTVKNGLVNL